MGRKKIYTSEIKDIYTQKNFEIIRDELNGNPLLKGRFVFVEISVPSSGSNQKFTHNLGFKPKDVLVLSTIGGTMTFLYNSFDSTYLYYDATVTTSPMTVRAYVGSYSENN